MCYTMNLFFLSSTIDNTNHTHTNRTVKQENSKTITNPRQEKNKHQYHHYHPQTSSFDIVFFIKLNSLTHSHHSTHCVSLSLSVYLLVHFSIYICLYLADLYPYIRFTHHLPSSPRTSGSKGFMTRSTRIC